ncbi:MAG: hypothetical protein FJW36_11840 [Acidobacteria bacterium]|nr:hypothetical protein [Acidobacteriota bacterium]
MTRVLKTTACTLLSLTLLQAQRGGNDWMTVGNDVQRSHWLRFDGKISEQTMRKPGFELQWKMKPKNTPRQQNALTSPALLDFYISYRGFRTLGFFGGSGDTTIGIDTDLARLEWQNGAGTSMAKPGTPACPGGMTSTITRPTQVPYPLNVGRGQGRANPARSGVGEPYEGAVTLQQRMAPRPAPPPAPAPAGAAPARRVATPPNPFGRTPLFVNAITSDGMLHAMYVSNGEEPKLPLQFLPAGAHALGLTTFDGNSYVATINGCNGVANGIWGINLESKKVSHWKATGKNIEGSPGFAVGPEGELYATSGNQLVALKEGTLEQRAAYEAGASSFTSSPVVFDFKGKNYIAASTADGSVHVVNAETMALVTKSNAIAGNKATALASWEDEGKTRWVLVPTATNVTALKLTDKGFEAGWTSREIPSAITPTIVNGVVFAAAPGNAKGGKAVLYAMEGTTGKELYNSGTTLQSYVSSGGLAAGGGRVYISTADGTQYAFGFYMEH